ncbi:hypothetical protein XELAEV_18045376mg [Xenopus laevis]|uniref:Uncharacterized protein n=1 Tax=Xenopus laevis TaxID=8355 RepID=A0A974C0A9_XENLA|nr:hypothetical protein XELAEV_18045376mg [Xenopus laevis]
MNATSSSSKDQNSQIPRDTIHAHDNAKTSSGSPHSPYNQFPVLTATQHQGQQIFFWVPRVQIRAVYPYATAKYVAKLGADSSPNNQTAKPTTKKLQQESLQLFTHSRMGGGSSTLSYHGGGCNLSTDGEARVGHPYTKLEC